MSSGLVDYATSSDSFDEESDSSSDESVPVPAKRPTLSDQTYNEELALPSASSLFSHRSRPDTQKHVEDPSRHGGRKRSFPHQRGNWASLVCIPYHGEVSDLQEVTDKLQRTLAKLCPTLQFYTMSDSHHISLSRTFVLLHHWIDGFVDSLQASLQSSKDLSSDCTVEFSGCEVLVNDEKTRSFVVLTLSPKCARLVHTLTGKVNECLAQFRNPEYYENPSYHISVLWCLGDATAFLSTALKAKLEHKAKSLLGRKAHRMKFSMQHVMCKIGNKIYDIPLTAELSQ